MVAAWISADTGVGPSIASGSHVWRPTWADLPTAPTNRKKQIKSSRLIGIKKNGTLMSDMIDASIKIIE